MAEGLDRHQCHRSRCPARRIGQLHCSREVAETGVSQMGCRRRSFLSPRRYYVGLSRRDHSGRSRRCTARRQSSGSREGRRRCRDRRNLGRPHTGDLNVGSSSSTGLPARHSSGPPRCRCISTRRKAQAAAVAQNVAPLVSSQCHRTLVSSPSHNWSSSITCAGTSGSQLSSMATGAGVFEVLRERSPLPVHSQLRRRQWWRRYYRRRSRSGTTASQSLSSPSHLVSASMRRRGTGHRIWLDCGLGARHSSRLVARCTIQVRRHRGRWRWHYIHQCHRSRCPTRRIGGSGSAPAIWIAVCRRG